MGRAPSARRRRWAGHSRQRIHSRLEDPVPLLNCNGFEFSVHQAPSRRKEVQGLSDQCGDCPSRSATWKAQLSPNRKAPVMTHGVRSPPRKAGRHSAVGMRPERSLLLFLSALWFLCLLGFCLRLVRRDGAEPRSRQLTEEPLLDSRHRDRASTPHASVQKPDHKQRPLWWFAPFLSGRRPACSSIAALQNYTSPLRPPVSLLRNAPLALAQAAGTAVRRSNLLWGCSAVA